MKRITVAEIKRDPVLHAYRNVYRSVHQRDPDLFRNVSWIYIDGMGTAFRRTDLRKMTDNLRRRAGAAQDGREPGTQTPTNESASQEDVQSDA